MATEKRSVLFFARNPHNVVGYERVLRRLLADSRVRLYLTSKNNHYSPRNALFDSFDLEGARLLHHRLAALRRFDLYLSPDIYLLSGRSRVKVHTFHGISIKGKSYTSGVLPYDRLFLIGAYQRRRFSRAGVLADDDPRFVEVGMPKTDALFDGSLDREVYLRSRGLDPSRPTILYAPTWRPESSLYSVGESLIASMRGGPYNFLIKLHDLVYETPERIDWRARLAELRGPRISVVEDLDVTPALHAADLLISDASSVANEFTLLDRPIVFIETPALFEKYAATIDRTDWGQSAGLVARDLPAIGDAVKKALGNRDLCRTERRRIAAEGFYNPGRATQAALAEIYTLLELTPPPGEIPPQTRGGN